MRQGPIALIGFGEVGQTLAEDLLAAGAETIRAFDLEFAEPGSPHEKAAARLGVAECASAADAVKGAPLVISAVTAAQTVNAAKSAASAMEKGAVYLDVNSASPAAKKEAAAIIDGAGGRYIEASIMSPIHPKRIAAPVYLGGPHARDVESELKALGFSGAKFFSAEPGKTAAVKLCRSVMIKGMEALISESMLAARRYGVEDDVLSSLSNLFPHPDWPAHARYMISRTLQHGARRAEEMREAAKTVEDAGVSPLMSSACAQRQDRGAAFAYALEQDNLHDMLDAILAGANGERRL